MRILPAILLSLASVSASSAQVSFPRIGLLNPGDLYIDGIDMGDSSRALTTVAKPLRRQGSGVGMELTISFSSAMDRRDTTYQVVLNGVGFDTLFAGSPPVVEIAVDGHRDSLVGGRGFPNSQRPLAPGETGHLWYRVPVALLRATASGKVAVIRLVGRDGLGEWELDESAMALLRRLLGIV